MASYRCGLQQLREHQHHHPITRSPSIAGTGTCSGRPQLVINDATDLDVAWHPYPVLRLPRFLMTAPRLIRLDAGDLATNPALYYF